MAVAAAVVVAAGTKSGERLECIICFVCLMVLGSGFPLLYCCAWRFSRHRTAEADCVAMLWLFVYGCTYSGLCATGMI
jgi:hypothetical protein